MNVLAATQGLSFKAIGPFLVCDIGGKSIELETGEHGKEIVPVGGRTIPHKHDFISYYRTKDLDILDGEGTQYAIPDEALVLVLPQDIHSWVSTKKPGTVESIDHRHEKQKISAA